MGRWTGHTFHLYWRATGEHRWRMVPLEHTYYSMNKGCVWVEGVVWEGGHKTQDTSLKSQDIRRKAEHGKPGQWP